MESEFSLRMSQASTVGAEEETLVPKTHTWRTGVSLMIEWMVCRS